jgi:hypothetical protein
LKIRECDIRKIAFVSKNSLYEYLVMYFGLTTAPAYYMDLVNMEFLEYFDMFNVVFIDDVLDYSKDKGDEEHLPLVL